jgi:aldehyde dehydrogenase (NAD+)
MSIDDAIAAQRAFFLSGATRDLAFRRGALQRLHDVIQDWEPRLCEALYKDLRKSAFDSYTTEIGLCLAEARLARSKLGSWARQRRVRPEAFLLPSRARLRVEPRGVCLVLAPWNYPLQLALSPLIGAIAAGNTCILKPSERSPNVSAALAALVAQTFPPEHVLALEGDASLSQGLVASSVDFIFFTGSVPLGKKVMEAASARLTPVALELGGKSPAIVESDADLRYAARRLAWGKFLNAGQTCVAPDYVLIHEHVSDQFLAELGLALGDFFQGDAKASPDYSRIVGPAHFDRLLSLMGSGRVAIGGGHDRDDLYIEPTVLVDVDPASPAMADEIFGPILPVLEYRDLDEAIDFVNARPKPLALYAFSSSKSSARRILDSCPSGGAGINTCVLQVSSSRLPFGGVGESGLGRYHGRSSFECFSSQRSVLYGSPSLDPGIMYPGPSRIGLSLARRFLK